MNLKVLPSLCDTFLIFLQALHLKYIGMVSATRFPLDIPILIRSVVGSAFQIHAKNNEPLGLDLDMLMVLNARTPLNDPSALVPNYKYNWWHSTRPPVPGDILWSGTLEECIKFHRRFI